MTVRLLVGDALTRLRELPDASVSMCCTSPPYYGLRSYSTAPQVWGGDPACAHSWQEQRYYVEGGGTAGSSKEAFSKPGEANAARIKTARWREDAYCTRCASWRGELGSEPTPELYCSNLVTVFREVRRILHPTGVLVLNLGDSYAGSGKGPTGHNGIGDQAERQGFTSRATRAKGGLQGGTATVDVSYGGKAAEGYKAKDLMQMPFKVAEALRQDGWYLRSVMPWLKRAAMPESVQDRPSNALEWLFLFSRSRSYFWDAESIRQTQSTATFERYGKDQRIPGSHRNGREDGTKGNDWAATSLLNGRAFRNTDPWFLSLDAAIADARADLARLEAMRATGGVLTDDEGLPIAVDVNPAAYKEAHFATYPPALVVPFVKAGTSERGCCPRCLAPWTRIGSGEQAQFAHALTEARERAGLSRKELAERLRLKSAASVNDWEAGGHLPKGEKWDALAAVLDLGVTREQFAEQVTYAKHKQNGTGKYERAAVGSTVLPTFTLRKGRTRTNADGWMAGCACDAGEPVKATVLDPFAGAGTTLLVASRLGRDAVGVELNEAYARMAEERIYSDAPLFVEVDSEAEAVPLTLFDLEVGA